MPKQACRALKPKTPLAMLVQVGPSAAHVKAPFSHTGPSSHTHQCLQPCWPMLAHVLQGSLWSRCWWEKHAEVGLKPHLSPRGYTTRRKS